MTVLCPVFCIAELTAHSHGPEADEFVPCDDGRHSHNHGGAPHRQHDSSGDPVPHGAHVCICATGAPPGPALQIPPLAPVEAIVAQVSPPASVTGVLRCDRLAAGPPDDLAVSDWNTPLLI